MKKAIFMLIAGFLANCVSSQSVQNLEKLKAGILFNYGTPKQRIVDVTSIARVTYPILKKVYIGLEINYLMRFGIENSDYAGGILFGKINPYLGFTGEVGYSYNKLISDSRTADVTKGLFASVGYEVKVNDHWSVDFQYRALPLKYLENNVTSSKVYLFGTSYTFLKKTQN